MVIKCELLLYICVFLYKRSTKNYFKWKYLERCNENTCTINLLKTFKYETNK